MLQDMQNGFAALVFDFTASNSSLTAVPSDFQITLTKLNLSPSSCISEAAYRFPGQLTDEELIPGVVYVNRTEMTEIVTDEDDKSTYTSAAIVWSIFFVILLLLVPASCYMFLKTRKQVGVEHEDLLKLEERVALKRGKLGENKQLIERKTTHTPMPKPEKRTPVNGPTPEHQEEMFMARRTGVDGNDDEL